MAEFAIGSRMVGDGRAPLVIAELGVNHNGNVNAAEMMIRSAADAGAECVKLQCHIPDEEATDGVPEAVRETIRRCSLTFEQERGLKAYAERRGLIFLSTPFSIAAADRLQAMGVLAFKIGSGELTNTPLLEHVARFGKPMIVSTGMSNGAEVLQAVNAIQAAGCYDVALLHCVSIYPTPPSEARLATMKRLQYADGEQVYGLSDHSRGIAVAIAAAALGAHIIEKHITLGHGIPCPDAAVSIDPHELRDLVSGARAAWEASQDMPKYYETGVNREPLPAELEVAAWARHSVTLRKPITAGEPFTPEHLTTKRPADGIPAARMRECIGRKATRDLPANAQLQEGDLA